MQHKAFRTIFLLLNFQKQPNLLKIFFLIWFYLKFKQLFEVSDNPSRIHSWKFLFFHQIFLETSICQIFSWNHLFPHKQIFERIWKCFYFFICLAKRQIFSKSMLVSKVEPHSKMGFVEIKENLYLLKIWFENQTSIRLLNQKI